MEELDTRPYHLRVARCMGSGAWWKWSTRCQRKKINSVLSLSEDSVRESNHYFASLRRDNNNNNMNIVKNISEPHLFTFAQQKLASDTCQIWSDWHQSHVNRQPSQCKDVINYHDLKNHLSHPLTLIGYLIHIILPN